MFQAKAARTGKKNIYINLIRKLLNRLAILIFAISQNISMYLQNIIKLFNNFLCPLYKSISLVISHIKI